MFHKLFITVLFLWGVYGCEDSGTRPEAQTKPVIVNVRMEVQILDSVNHIYSRPYTKIYFTTYKLLDDGSITELDQSDTTSCPNGWGVKEITYTLNNETEVIKLGAACESYNGPNLTFEEITYAQAVYQADSLSIANIKRTFAIYYK